MARKSTTPDEHYFFTSESVSMGHPDKVSDAVSDAVLDSLLAEDKGARVACETFCTTGMVVVGGEITVHNQKAVAALNNAEFTIRETLRKIGYTNDLGMKFDADTCGVMRVMHSQSADISQGVTAGEGVDKEQGAGDQGLMFGFAVKGLRPDAKSQVTVEYDINNKPVRIDTVVLSTQHTPDWNGNAKQKKLGQQVFKHIIEPVITGKYFKKGTKVVFNPTGKTRVPAGAVKVFVNPTGQFEIGGPHGDVGLTAAAATAAAPSRAKTLRRSTAAPPTWPVTSPRTWSPPASATCARCS